MVQLTGRNLCERQHELNRQVNEAVTNKIDFNNIKDETETSDIDRLFKIDIAAKYQAVDYIVETLKSGDSLYISRALKKSLWLYDEEYSGFINPTYLQQNIFPFMSIKMKKKLLTAVSMNLKNEPRAEEFFKYCVLGKLTNVADKFLIKTSETFKLQHILNDVVNNDIKYLKTLIGDSFTLLDACLTKQSEQKKKSIIKEFRHLYSVSGDQYLDLLEKYVQNEELSGKILGLRISKDVLVKHKDRVMKNPKFYINILSTSKIVRHSKTEDAKIYIVSLLPNNVDKFWNSNFYFKYKPIIDIIPFEERYAYIKKIFFDSYPSQEFEMSKIFYEQNYYELMSSTEQEAWALQHIGDGKELLGAGCDFMWYKFVNFETAFMESQKFIKIAKDHAKRVDILTTLIKAAKTQRNLEILLNYYYERHLNESKNIKELFLRRVISGHKVFEFDDSCWAAFNKILSSLRVYDTSGRGCNHEFKIVSVVYHILHAKELPEALIQYIENDMSSFSFQHVITELNDEKKQLIYDYIFQFYLERIEKFNPAVQDASKMEAIKLQVATYIHYILEFMASFKKTKSDIPEIVMKFVKLDRQAYRYQQILEEENENVTERGLLKLLKKDATLVVDKLPDLKKLISARFNMTKLLQKLKIYFVDNVAQVYLNFFSEMLHENNLYYFIASTAVFVIIQLADENKKIDFMKKYAPEKAKIDHTNTDSALLNIQGSICRFACYSRPPVPLAEMLKYLKGDYLPYCLPIFDRYLANLPQPLCLKFVQSVIDAPVSVQKHGLRLAFKCFNAEDLKNLIEDSWKKTKNVSLRSVIYKAFFQKTVDENSKVLFDVLKTLTLDLHEDDDDELFNILTSNKLSQEYLGEYVDVVWITINKFSNKESNLQRKANVISCIDKNINLIKRDTIKGIINDYVTVCIKKSKGDIDNNFHKLNIAKGELIAHYIVYFTSCELERKDNVELTKLIIEHFLEGWNVVLNDVYVNRRLCLDFINNLKVKSFWNDSRSYENANSIFETILKCLDSSLPLHEIYMIIWDLRLIIISRNVIEEGRKCSDSDHLAKIYKVAVKFGKEITNLVKEYVDNKKYYSHFSIDISDIISNYAFEISAFIPKCNVNVDNVLVAIVRGLLDVDMAETRILALELLPENLEDYSSDNSMNDLTVDYSSDNSMNDLTVVLEKLRENADMEMKCLIHNKYYRDCKRMRFL